MPRRPNWQAVGTIWFLFTSHRRLINPNNLLFSSRNEFHRKSKFRFFGTTFAFHTVLSVRRAWESKRYANKRTICISRKSNAKRRQTADTHVAWPTTTTTTKKFKYPGFFRNTKIFGITSKRPVLQKASWISIVGMNVCSNFLWICV